jgi:hypothetical protein
MPRHSKTEMPDLVDDREIDRSVTPNAQTLFGQRSVNALSTILAQINPLLTIGSARHAVAAWNCHTFNLKLVFKNTKRKQVSGPALDILRARRNCGKALWFMRRLHTPRMILTIRSHPPTSSDQILPQILDQQFLEQNTPQLHSM